MGFISGARINGPALIPPHENKAGGRLPVSSHWWLATNFRVALSVIET